MYADVKFPISTYYFFLYEFELLVSFPVSLKKLSWKKNYFGTFCKAGIISKIYFSLFCIIFALPLFWKDSFVWYIIFGWHFNFHSTVWICHSTAFLLSFILTGSKIFNIVVSLYVMWLFFSCCFQDFFYWCLFINSLTLI